ncbi:MAG: hypothetical protein M3Y87_18635, partial [Myxococcota bacterium]|nr:hypothetical protein [Myxococcota bacterium]
MNDPTTLDDLLEPLAAVGTGLDALEQIEAVAPNLATYFDTLVEPVLDALARDLSWKRRAALAGALGLVPATPRRSEVLARLLADPHAEVSNQALLSLRDAPSAEALAA